MHKTYSMMALAFLLASAACGADLNRQTSEMPNSDPAARPPSAQSEIVLSEVPLAQADSAPTSEPTTSTTPEPEPQPAPQPLPPR